MIRASRLASCEATVDGQTVLVGKPSFMDTERIDVSSAQKRIAELSAQGATVTCVALEGKLVGLIALADTVQDDAADAILVSDEVRRLPYLFDLSHKVMRKVRVNIVASLLINLSAVVLSTLGVLNPVTGALWHNFGSVFVVVNAALLLKERE